VDEQPSDRIIEKENSNQKTPTEVSFDWGIEKIRWNFNSDSIIESLGTPTNIMHDTIYNTKELEYRREANSVKLGEVVREVFILQSDTLIEYKKNLKTIVPQFTSLQSTYSCEWYDSLLVSKYGDYDSTYIDDIPAMLQSVLRAKRMFWKASPRTFNLWLELDLVWSEREAHNNFVVIGFKNDRAKRIENTKQNIDQMDKKTKEKQLFDKF
jgi:hypothetical protein